jgi:uncharacterized membrane protein
MNFERHKINLKCHKINLKYQKMNFELHEIIYVKNKNNKTPLIINIIFQGDHL